MIRIIHEIAASDLLCFDCAVQLIYGINRSDLFDCFVRLVCDIAGSDLIDCFVQLISFNSSIGRLKCEFNSLSKKSANLIAQFFGDNNLGINSIVEYAWSARSSILLFARSFSHCWISKIYNSKKIWKNVIRVKFIDYWFFLCKLALLF